VSASGGQKPQFWANFDFWGLLYRPPFTDEGQIWCAIADPWYTLTCQISSRSVYSVALCWQKKQFLPFFALRHLVLLPSEVKWVGFNVPLNTFRFGCQLAAVWESRTRVHNYKPSTIQRHQNRFCTPTPSWRNRAHSLTFKSVTNKQTDSQKNSFWPPRWRVKSEPHQTWHGDKGPRAHSCTSKTFGGLAHSFAARGRWKYGDNQTMST